MSGTLFVVATPIGHLEDITLRALRVLRDVDLIAAEDTRRTSRLLAHYAIPTPTVSFHAHNAHTRMPQLVKRLTDGLSVALVTDAGTPGVSDPGVELVAACWQHEIPVDPVPGPSAALAAAVASGFPLEPMTLAGFAPSRANNRTAWLARLGQVDHTVVFFEAPHRIEATLADVRLKCGGRPILVAREMTKRHQQFIRLQTGDDIWRMPEPRGEFTVVLGPKAQEPRGSATVTDREIADEFWRMPEAIGPKRRAAMAALAKKYGRTTKSVYSIVAAHRKSGE